MIRKYTIKLMDVGEAVAVGLRPPLVEQKSVTFGKSS